MSEISPAGDELLNSIQSGLLTQLKIARYTIHLYSATQGNRYTQTYAPIFSTMEIAFRVACKELICCIIRTRLDMNAFYHPINRNKGFEFSSNISWNLITIVYNWTSFIWWVYERLWSNLTAITIVIYGGGGGGLVYPIQMST